MPLASIKALLKSRVWWKRSTSRFVFILPMKESFGDNDDVQHMRIVLPKLRNKEG